MSGSFPPQPLPDTFGRREARVVASVAARELRVPAALLLGRDRRGRIALARQLAMAASRRLGYSLPGIGAAFERSHTTVLHAERTIGALAKTDPRIAVALERTASAAASELRHQARPVATPDATPAPSRASAPRLAPEFVGAYRAGDGRRRRLVLIAVDGDRQLVDWATGDVRVVQRFESSENLLQIASVAREYLQGARAEGRPLVARRPL